MTDWHGLAAPQLKELIEVEVHDRTVTLAVSAIVGVYKGSDDGIKSVLSLNNPAYIGPSNVSTILYLDLDYQELLTRIARAQS